MVLSKSKSQLVITIDRVVNEDLERISAKLGISKSKLARNLLYAGLDDAKIMERLGIVRAIGIFGGFSKKVDEKGFWANETGRLLDDGLKEK